MKERPERAVIAQRAPDHGLDLSRFPVSRLAAGARLFRAHTVGRGPWWFSSTGAGRFDLPPPRGTCYLADSALVSVRERLGIVLGSTRRVAASLLEGVVVSSLELPATVSLASLRSTRAADFGVLNELAIMVPYDVPQAWARAFADGGLGGVRYPARFSPGRPGAVALFGAAGDARLPIDPDPVRASDVPGAPAPESAPRLAEIKVVDTPRRK